MRRVLMLGCSRRVRGPQPRRARPYRITATVGAEVVRRIEPPVVDFATRAEQRIVVWIPAATLAAAGPSLELLVVAASVEPAEPSSNIAFRRLAVEPR